MTDKILFQDVSAYGDFVVDVRSGSNGFDISIQKDGATHALGLGSKPTVVEAVEFAKKVISSSHIDRIYEFAGGVI